MMTTLLALFAVLAASPDASLQARVEGLVGCGEKNRKELEELRLALAERVAKESTAARKARWELLELKLISSQACLLLGNDPRIYRDEAQGPRLERKVIWKLVDRAGSDPVAEEAAWFAVEHGRDFECEGYAPCYLAWTKLVECEYLRRFPSGPHAKESVNQIGKAADGFAAALKTGELPRIELALHDRDTVLAVNACLRKSLLPEAREIEKTLEQIALQIPKDAR